MRMHWIVAYKPEPPLRALPAPPAGPWPSTATPPARGRPGLQASLAVSSAAALLPRRRTPPPHRMFSALDSSSTSSCFTRRSSSRLTCGGGGGGGLGFGLAQFGLHWLSPIGRSPAGGNVEEGRRTHEMHECGGLGMRPSQPRPQAIPLPSGPERAQQAQHSPQRGARTGVISRGSFCSMPLTRRVAATSSASSLPAGDGGRGSGWGAWVGEWVEGGR